MFLLPVSCGYFSIAFNRILISLQTIRFFIPSIDVVYNQLKFEKNLHRSENDKASKFNEKILS